MTHPPGKPYSRATYVHGCRCQGCTVANTEAQRLRRTYGSASLEPLTGPRAVEPLEEGWKDQAACRGMDPDVFFPGRGDRAGVVKAKQICAGCPVVEECREYAFARGEKHGIYGGLSEFDRRRIRRRRSNAA